MKLFEIHFIAPGTYATPPTHPRYLIPNRNSVSIVIIDLTLTPLIQLILHASGVLAPPPPSTILY